MITDQDFPNGMTVRELKDWLDKLPDADGKGEERTVWIETGKGLSSPVTRALLLSLSVSSLPDLSGDIISADALLTSNAFVEWKHGA